MEPHEDSRFLGHEQSFERSNTRPPALECDPTTESPHIYNHQVNEDEVVDVLDNTVKIVRDAREPELHWAKQLPADF